MQGLVALGFGAALVPLGVIVLAIVAIAGGRSEPDPLHERPATLYLTAVSFFAVFAVLFAVFGLASSALNLTVDRHEIYDLSTPIAPNGGTFRSCTNNGGSTICTGSGSTDVSRPTLFSRGQHDADYRGIVIAIIAGVLAALLFLLHYRWLRRYLADRVDGPGVRVWHTYLYVACFFAVVVAIPAVGALVYDVFRVIAPGVTETTRGEALASLGSTAVLAAGAGILFLFHWNQTPLSTSVGVAPLAPTTPSPPPEPAPPAPPEPDPAPASAPRARKATKATKAVKKR